MSNHVRADQKKIPDPFICLHDSASIAGDPPRRALPRTRFNRVLIYTQALLGTGHFVRCYEIARALAQAEGRQVHLVDGSRAVPRPDGPPAIKLLSLPRVHRIGQNLESLDDRLEITEVMRRRCELLVQAVEQIKPDLVIVEHFPFAKWRFNHEIRAMIHAARACDPKLRVVCSGRDILLPSAYDLTEDQRRLQTPAALGELFDLLVLHGDPSFTRLEDQIDWVADIKIPIRYTGYVSQRPSASPSVEGRPSVICSTGGNSTMKLIETSIDAWKILEESGSIGDRRLIVFMPLLPKPGEFQSLQARIGRHSILLKPFQPDFLDWMRHADLSISQAGYNTCTNLLQTRTPAILAPDERMSDQCFRARLLSRRGLATHIPYDQLTAEELSRSILARLAAPPPRHSINLDGARITSMILSEL